MLKENKRREPCKALILSTCFELTHGVNMKIEKKILDEIDRCYCASHVTVDGELKVLLASEEIDGPCYSYSGENFEKKETVWEKAGGTMSIIEIPHTNGEFLAVQNFFPGFNSLNSKIVWGKYEDGRWVIKDFLKLPYVHRFDLLESEGKLFFIGATLCCSKKDRNDWSDPGRIWIGELPEDLNEEMEIKPIKDFLLKNHGYWRGESEGCQVGYVTCDSGIYMVTPPKGGSDWEVKQLLAGQISDVAVFDLDQDGKEELVTIGPFHGNELLIRKKVDDRRYETVYQYPNKMDFAHAVWAGNLLSKPSVVFGIRRMDCELGYIQFDTERNEYNTEIIEKGVGTANVDVVHGKDREIIIAANHTKNEAAVYILSN